MFIQIDVAGTTVAALYGTMVSKDAASNLIAADAAVTGVAPHNCVYQQVGDVVIEAASRDGIVILGVVGHHVAVAQNTAVVQPHHVRVGRVAGNETVLGACVDKLEYIGVGAGVVHYRTVEQ